MKTLHEMCSGGGGGGGKLCINSVSSAGGCFAVLVAPGVPGMLWKESELHYGGIIRSK